MNRDQLQREAFKARCIFYKHANEIDGTLFSNFPHGCCGNASLLLGNWLLQLGLKDIKVILAETKDDKSHSWLVVNDFIIDITADQLADHECGIFPIDSEYHRSHVNQTEDSLAVDGALAEALKRFVNLMEAIG